MNQRLRKVITGLRWPAALFLIPLTKIVGSYFLLIVFAFAAAVHVLRDQYDVGALVVYSMAVWVSLAQRQIEKHEDAR